MFDTHPSSVSILVESPSELLVDVSGMWASDEDWKLCPGRRPPFARSRLHSRCFLLSVPPRLVRYLYSSWNRASNLWRFTSCTGGSW